MSEEIRGIRPLVQLDHASSLTNQRPSELAKTATHNAPHGFRRVSVARVESLRSGNVTRIPGQGAQTFGHCDSLWNPVNSSAITAGPPTTLPAGADTPINLQGFAQQLRSLQESSPPNLGYSWCTISQSHSSLQVQISQPASSLSSPKTPLAYKKSPPLTIERERNITAPHKTLTMSPHPSLHSDAPSKRPPTPAKDLEYGTPNLPPQNARSRTPSRHSQRASLTESDLPWNPTHPCYPHPNPHMPRASPLHSTTRIIRIPRDWMIAGDLAPTFSNTYPEILEPWVSEADFRMLIKNINEGLIAAFSPHGWRAWMDAVLGVATGWIWEDLGFAGVKKGVRGVEQIIEEWNGQRRSTLEKEEDVEVVRAIPLRRTGYLCLDIQIPDPHVGTVEEEQGMALGSGNGNVTGDGSVGVVEGR